MAGPISAVMERATRPPTNQASHRPTPSAPRVARISLLKVWRSPAVSSVLGIPTATRQREAGDWLNAVSTGTPSSVTDSTLPSLAARMWASSFGVTGWPRNLSRSCVRATTRPWLSTMATRQLSGKARACSKSTNCWGVKVALSE